MTLPDVTGLPTDIDETYPDGSRPDVGRAQRAFDTAFGWIKAADPLVRSAASAAVAAVQAALADPASPARAALVDAARDQVTYDLTTDGRQARTDMLSAASAATAALGMLHATPGREYRIVAAPLRNGGSPAYWQPISDAGHAPVVGAVSTDPTKITVSYGFTGAKVVVGMVVVDETLAPQGIECGASVGTSSMTITLSRARLGDYISFTGAGWSSHSGVFTSPTFNASTGVLTLTHAPIGGVGAAATTRDSVNHAQLGSVGPTTTEVLWRTPAGTVIKTPDSTMRAFVERFGGGPVDPRLVGLGSYENLWVLAVVEV